jgi:hypothetical protein
MDIFIILTLEKGYFLFGPEKETSTFFKGRKQKPIGKHYDIQKYP